MGNTFRHHDSCKGGVRCPGVNCHLWIRKHSSSPIIFVTFNRSQIYASTTASAERLPTSGLLAMSKAVCTVFKTAPASRFPLLSKLTPSSLNLFSMPDVAILLGELRNFSSSCQKEILTETGPLAPLSVTCFNGTVWLRCLVNAVA